MLREALPQYPEEVLQCLDLILRWSVVRLAEGNTQTLLSVLAMLKVRLGGRVGECKARVRRGGELFLQTLMNRRFEQP